MTRTWRLRLGLLACVACLVGCDHATKLAAAAALRNRAPLPVVPGAVDLTYTENRDVAFSALSHLSLHPPAWALAASAAALTLLVVVGWARRRRATWSQHAGFALICAGAVGNLVDRFAHGYVVDFIHVRFWPVFNVADVLVVVGLALLAFGRTVPPRMTGTGGTAATGHR